MGCTKKHIKVEDEADQNAEAAGGRAKKPQSEIIYNVDDCAPWHITVMYVAQQILSLAPTNVAPVAAIHAAVCGGDDYLFLAELVGTSLFMLGLGTILQITFGIRLPIIQGSSWVFLAPITAMMTSERYKCPEPLDNYNATANATEPAWNPRIRVLSGSLIVGAAVQTLLGLTGVFGILIPYIGPLTIAPAMALLGISLYPTIMYSAQANWGIAMLVVAINVVFGAVLRDVKVPLPSYSKDGGWTCNKGHYLFRLLPKITSIAVAWLLCYVLTITNVFTNNPEHKGYMARTDVKLSSFEHASWFFFPYPGRWGSLSVDLGLVISMVVASVMGMVESIGDYYILARACEKPTPPRHALNRGLAMEGFVNMLCGSLTMGHGTASYSEPLAFLKISGLASRMVWQILGGFFILIAVVGKIGGALAMIPEPILGGLNITGLGLIITAGLSNLQFANMNSSRNLLILAVSLMVGLAVPFWVLDNPAAIKTDEDKVDEILNSLLTSPMFIGGILGFTLDNLIPGSKKERGLLAYQVHLGMADGEQKIDHTVYDLPLLTAARCGQIRCCTYIPFLPTHKERKWRGCCPESPKYDDDDDVESTTVGDGQGVTTRERVLRPNGAAAHSGQESDFTTRF